MADYPYFPMFVDLSNRRVLVVGAGRIAARRVRVMSQFTPNVTVVAPDVSPEVEALAGGLAIVRREFRPSDLDGADIVLAATDDARLNAEIGAACRSRGIPVNVGSDRALCDFYFPGIARYGDVVAGVTASGRDHALAARATRRVEAALQNEFEHTRGGKHMKKAIIAVSFGTTHEDAVRGAIEPVERTLAEAFEGWTVCRAWTSRMIARKLRERGTPVENEREAIERLKAEGYERIALASTHIIGGREYDKLKDAADGLPVSAPLLDTDDDLNWMAALLGRIADEEGRTLLVMGHGTEHAADETYARLRGVLPANVRLACVEGSHGLDELMPELDAMADKRLTLMPLMLVAGDHAKNDLAGDDEDSWKSRLQARGFDVRARLRGLGALPEVRARFVEKVRAAIGEA